MEWLAQRYRGRLTVIRCRVGGTEPVLARWRICYLPALLLVQAGRPVRRAKLLRDGRGIGYEIGALTAGSAASLLAQARAPRMPLIRRNYLFFQYSQTDIWKQLHTRYAILVTWMITAVNLFLTSIGR